MAADREEAGVELAVGRDPRARAVAAERLRHRGDDADLARAVEVAVALGDLAAVGGLHGLERKLGADRRDDLGGGHDVVHPPAVRRADVHELDEAHSVAGAAEAARDVEDRRLVQAALDDDVDLDREPGLCGRVDAREHARHREVDVVHRAEDLVVERVEADRDPRQPGVRERLRLLRQQRGVGRQGEVEVVAERGEPLDQGSRSRRSSGSPPVMRSFCTPRSTKTRATRSISSKRQELAPRQEAVVVAEDLLRHAVDAAEVAAVGDRDAEIAHRPAERVEDGHPDEERRESGAVNPARAPSRPRRRHGDLGRHIRPGAGRARALSAVRVPRGAVRDLDGRRSRRSPGVRCERSAIRVRGRVGVGVLLAGAYGLQTAGLELTTVASTGFITGLYVVFTPLLALALFGTPVPRALWVGVVLAVVGLLLLNGVPGGSALGNVLVLGERRRSRRSRSPRWSVSRRATTRAR